MTAGWAIAVGLLLASTAAGQIVPPSSHPGSLPGQPTNSILIGSDLATYRTWWASPANTVQAAWKANVVGTAGGSMTLAEPTTFAEASAQSKVVQARALRWLMEPAGPNAASDLSSVASVLSNYARITSGSTITEPEIGQNYFQAFDFINAGLDATQRAAVTSRLSGSNVLGQLGNPLQVNNQQLKQASSRAFAALLFNNDSEIDTQLGRIRDSLGYNSTDDGGYTDGLRYLNYSIAQFAPFVVAYRNHTGVDLGTYIEPFVRMGLGVRMPNGLTPSAHNSDNTALAIHQFAQVIGDSSLKAATAWNVTQLGTHDWTTWTNVVNNDWTYTDFFALGDFSVAPAAPNWSPTYFSGGQAQAATFRSDWGTSSHYLNLSAGIDGAGIAGFTQHDTGSLTLCANGTQVLVEPGYNRSGLAHSPGGFDSSRATEHNVLLARDAGNSTWGIGNGTSQTNTGTTVSTTNRLDSAEHGSFKGAADFVSLRATYGGSSAGNDVQARRSAAFVNEDYFVVADSVRRTDSTNKDFAVNLIGKSKAADTQIVTNSAAYMQLRWAVNDYDGDGYNGGVTVSGYPYNQTQNGQVIAHVVGSTNGSLSVAQDTTWMHETYDHYQQTQRLRVAMSNVPQAAFLTIFELGTYNAASQLAVSSFSGELHASARAVNAAAGWTDWIISQTSSSNVHATGAGAQVSIDGGALDSDAQFAYLRRVGGAPDSVMLSRGTNLSSDGQQILSWDNPATVSLLLATLADGQISGTLSMDDFTNNSVLTLCGLPGEIISVSYDGSALASFTDDAVTFPSVGGAVSAPFVVTFTPEPASITLLALAGLAMLRRRR